MTRAGVGTLLRRVLPAEFACPLLMATSAINPVLRVGCGVSRPSMNIWVGARRFVKFVSRWRGSGPSDPSLITDIGRLACPSVEEKSQTVKFAHHLPTMAFAQRAGPLSPA